jgi:hypothetical protein
LIRMRREFITTQNECRTDGQLFGRFTKEITIQLASMVIENKALSPERNLHVLTRCGCIMGVIMVTIYCGARLEIPSSFSCIVPARGRGVRPVARGGPVLVETSTTSTIRPNRMQPIAAPAASSAAAPHARTTLWSPAQFFLCLSCFPILCVNVALLAAALGGVDYVRAHGAEDVHPKAQRFRLRLAIHDPTNS